MRENSFSIVIRAVDNLFMVFLKYPGNDGLCYYTDTTIVHHSCPECVQPLRVHRCICLQQCNKRFLVSQKHLQYVDDVRRKGLYYFKQTVKTERKHLIPCFVRVFTCTPLRSHVAAAWAAVLPPSGL